MSIPSSVDITSFSSTISDTIATNNSTATAVKETTASNNSQLQAQHQHALLQQQQQIQRQRLLEQQQQQQLQFHLQIQQRQQNTILLKQQQQQHNSQTPPIQQDQLPQQRQHNMLQQRIFQQQQGFPLPLSISFDQHQQSQKMDGPPPLKRSRLMTMSHSGSSPLTPLSADSPMFGMNNTAFSQPLYMDPQHYHHHHQQQHQQAIASAAATTVQSMTPDQFAGNDFEWMAAAAVASELSSNGGLVTPGSTPQSRSVTASGASSLPSPSMSSATTSTMSSSASSTATATTSMPVSVVVPSNITSSPVMHLTSSSSSISVSTSDKHPLESSSTTASPEMSEATIASEDPTSLRSQRTTRGSAQLPTPIHPLSTELHHPHAVVPSQNFHTFSQHHHALGTPTSAAAPTPPLPLPSSHHHQFQQQQQQQQQEDFNGLGLGLGLGLNLAFYDFMPMSQQQPSTSSTSAPSTPNPSTTATSNNTIPSPIPKAVMAHLRSSSNNSSPVTSHLPHPHPLGPPVLRSNGDSPSSASSPSMMDLTGMASGLEAVVASNSIFGRQSSLPHIHNSRIIKSMSSSTASSSASSSGIMTHSSKFASRGSFSASSVQTSPELDAASHNVGDMDYEDGTGTSGAGEDDDQNTNEEDNEENSDEDDDDDPENNRPAVCPHCLKEFQSKGLLRSHIVSHSSDRPFVCRDCSDKSYKRNHDLLRHRREKHNVEGAVIPPRGSGRHSHSGASGSASKRSSALAGLGMGGDLMMGGGLVGFVGSMRSRNHRRSCSSAILGSGLGTRSSTTPYSMGHGHVHHHHPGMGLSEQYPSAVTVISQQHQHQQQQQNKIPSPHDLMFASSSSNAAASGMMYLNTDSLLSAVSGGNNNRSLPARSSPMDPFGGGTGLEFPHLSSMGPPLPLPSQKHQLYLQQQQSQPLSQVFGHHQFTHQQPQTQTQQVRHNNSRRASQQHQLSQVPPPLQQYHHSQHQNSLHPLQHPHPLSLQFQQQQQQQQNAMLHQAPRLASQQLPSLDMNLGLSLGLGPLEMSSSTSGNTLAEQQRRASAVSLSSATSSSISLSSTTASSVAETPLHRKRRLSDSDITVTNSGTTPTVVTMAMMTSSSTPSTPSIASAPQVNSDGSVITTSSAEYFRDRTVSSPASVLMSQQSPFIPLINQAW